ncbi:60S ribosomal protein L44 [Tanacetum coccineum]
MELNASTHDMGDKDSENELRSHWEISIFVLSKLSVLSKLFDYILILSEHSKTKNPFCKIKVYGNTLHKVTQYKKGKDSLSAQQKSQDWKAYMNLHAAETLYKAERVYITGVSAYRDALKVFIVGCQEGIQQVR